MAVSNYRALQAFKAAVDLSGGYGKGVVVSNASEHTVTLPSAAGPILGVIVEAAPQGGSRSRVRCRCHWREAGCRH